MAELRERDIEAHANRYAEKLGCWQRKFSSPGRRAVPDRIYSYEGRTWFVEYKAPGKKPTKLQNIEHRKMRAAGLRVYVCDSKEGARAIIDKEIKEAGAL